MPPQQCPECGRFLSKALVDSLLQGDEPCPKCETMLTASMFYEFVADPDELEEPVDEPDDTAPVSGPDLRDEALDAADPAALDATPSTVTAGAVTGVRPPDLAPRGVHETDRAPGGPAADGDVLADWDTADDVVELSDWRRSRGGAPVDAIVLACGGVAGALLGLLTARERRGTGAVLGLVTGVAGAAISRQVWRLEG